MLQKKKKTKNKSIPPLFADILSEPRFLKHDEPFPPQIPQLSNIKPEPNRLSQPNPYWKKLKKNFIEKLFTGACIAKYFQSFYSEDVKSELRQDKKIPFERITDFLREDQTKRF